MQVDLAQELLFSRRVDLVLHRISIGSDGSVFDVKLFELVVCDMGVHFY